MTAISELFCNEEVRDIAEQIFGDLIPEYETIKVPDEWKGIWAEIDYPKSGYICYLDENNDEVARVNFDVEFEFHKDVKELFSYPTNLHLRTLGDKSYRQRTVESELNKLQNRIRNLRDNQEEAPCLYQGGPAPDVCNLFDYVIDDIEKLKKRFKGEKPYVEILYNNL